MPFAINQGVRIYYEVEGSGPPILLVHGLTSRLDAWREYGYTNDLRADHRLVLLDLRGHGRSDKPHRPEDYAPELITGDVLAVLNDLGIARCHYLGYSLGALIGWHMTQFTPDRFWSLMLGGMGPYGFRTDAEKQYARTTREVYRWAAAEGNEALVCWLESRGNTMTPDIRARVMSDDALAFLAFLDAAPAWPSLAAILHTIALPCLVWAGDADILYDGAREGASHLLGATFVSLPGLVHSEAQARSDLVLPHIRSLLARVEKDMAEATGAVGDVV